MLVMTFMVSIAINKPIVYPLAIWLCSKSSERAREGVEQDAGLLRCFLVSNVLTTLNVPSRKTLVHRDEVHDRAVEEDSRLSARTAFIAESVLSTFASSNNATTASLGYFYDR